MRNISKKIKWILVVCLVVGLIFLCVGITKMIYIKLADTSWIEDIGYDKAELYTLKLDRAGCPMIPVEFERDIYYFNFDTGCSSDIVMTNVLEDKIDYTITEQIEQLNRDGSHRGWSHGITISQLELFGQAHKDLNSSMIEWDMSSSYKFNGLVGTKLFENRIVTLV